MLVLFITCFPTSSIIWRQNFLYFTLEKKNPVTKPYFCRVVCLPHFFHMHSNTNHPPNNEVITGGHNICIFGTWKKALTCLSRNIFPSKLPIKITLFYSKISVFACNPHILSPVVLIFWVFGQDWRVVSNKKCVLLCEMCCSLFSGEIEREGKKYSILSTPSCPSQLFLEMFHWEKLKQVQGDP